MKKRWIATRDGRVRDWHAELDGIVVGQNEPFENSVGEIMYPGDFSADPANVYNCRCCIAYDVVGFKGADGKVAYVEGRGENSSVEQENPIDKLGENGYNIYRKSGNSGAFEHLPEKMSKKHIREVAVKFGIDIDGLILNIDNNEELLRFNITGEAVPDKIGKITFFPNAFTSEEELVRTLYHEKQHVQQFKEFGAEYVQNHLNEFERLAYGAEELFVERLKKEGKL